MVKRFSRLAARLRARAPAVPANRLNLSEELDRKERQLAIAFSC